MDKISMEKLRLVYKNSVFNNTLYSYVGAVVEIFLKNPSKVAETCDALGLTEEELLDILKSPTFSTMKLLDEIMDLNEKNVKNNSCRR